MIPPGERQFRQAVEAFVVYYHRERNHQAIGKQLIGVFRLDAGAACVGVRGLGGLMNHYDRAALCAMVSALHRFGELWDITASL